MISKRYKDPHQYDALPFPKNSVKSPDCVRHQENDVKAQRKINDTDQIDTNEIKTELSNDERIPDINNLSADSYQYSIEKDDSSSSYSAINYNTKDDNNFLKNKLSLKDEILFYKFVMKTHKRGYRVLVIPLLIFLCLLTAGFTIAIAQRNSYIASKEKPLEINTLDTIGYLADSFEAALHPLSILRGVIRQERNASKIIPVFQGGMGAEALSVSRGATANIQYAPNGVVKSVYPSRGNEKVIDHELFQLGSQYGIFNGTTYLYPNRRNEALETVRTRDYYIVGPYQLAQGYSAMIARLPVFVENVDINETFDQDYDIMSFNCSICYNSTTKEKVWGILVSLLYWDKLNLRVTNLKSKFDYRYELFSVDAITGQKKIILQSVPSPRHMSIAFSANIIVHNLNWVLLTEYNHDPEPVWFIPLVVIVIVIALTLALLTTKIILNDMHRELLLHSILPPQVLSSMKEGEQYIEEFKNVSVLFTDIVGFTEFSASISPKELAIFLHELYSEFDRLVTKHKVFKVETIGDSFVCCCGCPYLESSEVSAKRIISMALDMIQTVSNFVSSDGHSVQIRAGVHTGPIVGCVMGHKSPRFCLVGDTMNTASRMESNSEAMRLNCSRDMALVLKKYDNDGLHFHIESRGILPVKGKGSIEMFWVSRSSHYEGRVPDHRVLQLLSVDPIWNVSQATDVESTELSVECSEGLSILSEEEITI